MESPAKVLRSAVVVITTCAAAFSLESPSRTAKAGGSPPKDLASGRDTVDIQRRNVNFRISAEVVLEVRSLRGRIESTKPEAPVNFDDGESFTVNIVQRKLLLPLRPSQRS